MFVLTLSKTKIFISMKTLKNIIGVVEFISFMVTKKIVEKFNEGFEAGINAGSEPQ